MTVDIDHCYLCLRDQDASQGPVMPAGFTARRESGGWYTIMRDSTGSPVGAAWRANTNAAGTRGLYAVFGPLSILNALAAIEPLCMPARELLALVIAGNAPAIAVARRWPTWRFSGSERDIVSGSLVAVSTVVRRLIFDGQTLPAPPLPSTGSPWRFSSTGAIVATDAACRYRVTSLVRPALDTTLAGYTLHTVAEDEPVRT